MKKKRFIMEAICALLLFFIIVFLGLQNSSKEKNLIKNLEETEMSAEEYFENLALTKSYKKENANNVIYTQRFGPDPGVMEYNGRIYVYMTDDIVEYDEAGAVKENTYGLIKTINCISSEDMVNWTDHGQWRLRERMVQQNGHPIHGRHVPLTRQ